MIEKLTKAQEKKLKTYLDKWTKIGLCTKRANRKKAEDACREAYKVAGLTPPKMIFWAESPMGLLLTAKFVKELAAKGYKPHADNDYDSVRASVRASVWASVWASVGDSVWASVGASVRDSVGASVRDSVRDSVWASVGDSVWASVWASVRDSQLRAEWNELGSYGQHDAGWLSFYDYFREACGLEKETKKLLPLTALAKETGWHLFYKDVAILSEKPTELHRNEQGRLHNFNGPAIKWADGYEMYRWNGISIPREIAQKQEFTKSDIVNQANADVGREIIRKIGMQKAIEVLEPKVLDEAKTETGGTYQLLSINYDGRSERPYLKMNCTSSGETFILGVRPELKTVKESLAFLNNINPGEETKTLWEA